MRGQAAEESMYTYKESGIAWIGKIPAHWEVRKIKYLAELYGRIGWQGKHK